MNNINANELRMRLKETALVQKSTTETPETIKRTLIKIAKRRANRDKNQAGDS